jgi:hypothetical protein
MLLLLGQILSDAVRQILVLATRLFNRYGDATHPKERGPFKEQGRTRQARPHSCMCKTIQLTGISMVVLIIDRDRSKQRRSHKHKK